MAIYYKEIGSLRRRPINKLYVLKLNMALIEEQKEICNKHNVSMFIPDEKDKIGIALSTLGKVPINGLRHPIENGTCGWYIWCGEELSEEIDFFKPLHVKHIKEYLPAIEKYLALPVGYRFLISDNHEDIWLDATIKNV